MNESMPAIDQELNALPDRYRRPLILFHLEQKSLEETARLMGANAGTVGSWLKRGREMLKQRIDRQSLSESRGAVLLLLLQGALAEANAPKLLPSVRNAALRIAMGQSQAYEHVPQRIIELTKGVLQMWTIGKIKLVMVLLLAGSLLGGAAYVAGAAELGAAKPAPAAIIAPPGRALTAEEIIQKVDEAIQRSTGITVDWSKNHFKGAPSKNRFVLDSHRDWEGGGSDESHLVYDGVNLSEQVVSTGQPGKVLVNVYDRSHAAKAAMNLSPLGARKYKEWYDFNAVSESTLDGSPVYVLTGTINQSFRAERISTFRIAAQQRVVGENGAPFDEKAARRSLDTWKFHVYIGKDDWMVHATAQELDGKVTNKTSYDVKTNVLIDDKDFAWQPPAGAEIRVEDPKNPNFFVAPAAPQNKTSKKK